MGARAKLFVGAVAASACLCSRTARAQSAHDDDADVEASPPTFSYQTRADENYLRAVVEFETVFAVGLLYYMTTSGRNWDLGYRWASYEQKFTWGAFGPDQNHFGTNFIGHPLGGAGYYVSARSNRLSPFESFAFAFAGSLLWEYFGEITERVSLNDTVVTPTAGVAIGEGATQLGAFFDRSAATPANRALGVVFAPFKSVNDWADDLRLRRASRGWAEGEWHRFDLDTRGVLIHPSGAASRGGALLHLGSQLARLPDYDVAGNHRFWFADANVSQMDLTVTFTEPGVSDLSFDTRVMLGGHYFRGAQGRPGALTGGGVVVGPTTAFEYSLHDYPSRTDIDRISYVQPLALSLLHRLELGSATLSSELHAGPSFGGLTPHAYDAYTGDSELLPEVLNLHRYYFGVGGVISLGARLSYRRLELGASMSTDAHEMIQDRPPTGDVSVRDLRSRSSARIGVRLAESPVFLRAEANHLLRVGSMGSASAESREVSWGVGLAGVF